MNTDNDEARRRVTIERHFDATPEDVWALWTTPDGIESWWGPEGFSVTVRTLDLRPGGALLYTMTATAPPQVAFMQQHGMPLATEATITYTEVTPPTRLVYVHLVDFVPGVATYSTTTVVQITGTPTGTRMVLTFDAMHDAEWTERATAGWLGELGKLARVIAGRAR